MSKLKKLRVKQNLTQEKIARELNISLRQYQYIEQQKVITNVITALAIAKILQSTVEEIFSE